MTTKSTTGALWTLLATLFLTVAASAGSNTAATNQARDKSTDAQQQKAVELIRQAQEALGGESKIAAISSLKLSGSFQRPNGEASMSGQIEMLFSLPDKFKRIETSEMAGGIVELTRIEAVDGENEWNDLQTSGGEGGNVIIRKAPAGEGAGTQAHRFTHDFARQMLGLLLRPVAAAPVQFTYAGKGEFGEATADVVDATGAAGFAVRLFLDSGTHRPLLMTYKGVEPAMTIRTMQMSGSKKDAEKAAGNAAAQMQPPQEKQFEVKFSDYRQVGGIWLPFQITRAVEGKVSEELTIKDYRINPAFKADEFKKKN